MIVSKSCDGIFVREGLDLSKQKVKSVIWPYLRGCGIRKLGFCTFFDQGEFKDQAQGKFLKVKAHF